MPGVPEELALLRWQVDALTRAAAGMEEDLTSENARLKAENIRLRRRLEVVEQTNARVAREFKAVDSRRAQIHGRR